MWIDEYEKLMFSVINDDKKTIQAVQIKNDNMPELFYKYSIVDDNRLNSLKNDTLYFSSISALNDPFECAMVLPRIQIEKLTYKEILKNLEPMLKPGFKLSLGDITSLEDLNDKIMDGLIMPIEDRNKFVDFIKPLNKYTQCLINNSELETSKGLSQIGYEIYKICCFSTIEDSMLMWSHYADVHQGFCLAYNFKELKNDLTDLILPVRYSERPLDVTEYFIPNSNKSLIMNALTKKSTEWSYEREWRIIVSAKNKEKGQFEKAPIPKKIFLGSKMSEGRKKEIMEIAVMKNIEVYQMKMKHNEYKLYSERVK